MPRWLMLSFGLSENTPAAGGRRALSIQVDECLAQGHPGNTYFFTAWNHAGTHVDAPGHMFQGYPTITQFEISDLIFDHPYLVNVPKGPDQLITAADLEPHEQALTHCDLLLLKTGFSYHREVDCALYRDRNPGMSVDLARYLSASRFGLLRAIGIDCISMAAACQVAEGVEAHRIFFARQSHHVLLIEDMDLSMDLTGLMRVIVAPLFIHGIDSGPCTILAQIDDAAYPTNRRQMNEAARQGSTHHRRRDRDRSGDSTAFRQGGSQGRSGRPAAETA